MFDGGSWVACECVSECLCVCMCVCVFARRYMSRSAAAIDALPAVGARVLGRLLVRLLAGREMDEPQTTRACALALNNFAAQVWR